MRDKYNFIKYEVHIEMNKQTKASKKKTLGVLKWYSKEKGYGVIQEVNSHKEVFLHCTNWVDNQPIVNNQSRVLILEISNDRNRDTAKECRYFDYSYEDYLKLYELIISYDKYLYIKDDFQREIKIIDLFDKENLKINNFLKILENTFNNLSDHDFFNEINDHIDLFSHDLVNEVFLHKESLKRFKDSLDSDFKRNLIKKDYININEIDLNFILSAFEFNMNLINKIKNHPSFLSDIIRIIDQSTNKAIVCDLIFIAIQNNIQEITPYIDNYIISIDEDFFIKEMHLLSKKLEVSSIEYNLQFKIHQYLEQKNNNLLILTAFNQLLIELSDAEIAEKYIDCIDTELFFKLEMRVSNINTLLSSVLDKNKNQELLHYIISKFEDYEINNYQDFLSFGIKRLIELNEENQVLYLKKLFHLKYLKKLNFELSDLSMFNDIRVLELAYKNKNNIDFSTFLIIDLIAKFSETDGFMATHGLIKSVLNFIQFDTTKKVKIHKYFGECNGYAREIISSKDEIISKESFISNKGSENYYFKISFSYQQSIVDDIKKISGRKYNQEGKYWGIPLRSENEVIEFGKKHGFIIKLNEGNYFSDNAHIVEVKKNPYEKPIGYTFCSGQEAQKLSFSGKKFWWCNQSQCFQNNIEKNENWKEYKLFDFMKILNLNLLEKTSNGMNNEIGLYTRFITLINRFNRLLERLYCTECGNILYPLENSNFHANAVTKFVCKNTNCSCKNRVIYLNHCLNGQCNAIIDSRVSQKCSNGLYICEDCGSCCAHGSFERRLKNLNITGGIEYDRLHVVVANKLGHLERAEYFCYKCGQITTEYSNSLYRCNECDVEYDLSKYSRIHTKQIHKALRSHSYPKKPDLIVPQLKKMLMDEKALLESKGRSRQYIFGRLFNKEIKISGILISLKKLGNKQLTNEVFQ